MAIKNSGVGMEDNLEFLEGDINRFIVNGIPAIDFSDRIHRILFKETESTVVLKLLGAGISYGDIKIRSTVYRDLLNLFNSWI